MFIRISKFLNDVTVKHTIKCEYITKVPLSCFHSFSNLPSKFVGKIQVVWNETEFAQHWPGGELAHMVERSLSMREVPGSIPGFSRWNFFQWILLCYMLLKTTKPSDTKVIQNLRQGKLCEWSLKKSIVVEAIGMKINCHLRKFILSQTFCNWWQLTICATNFTLIVTMAFLSIAFHTLLDTTYTDKLSMLTDITEWQAFQRHFVTYIQGINHKTASRSRQDSNLRGQSPIDF